MNLSLAGCGFLGIYHVGVASCFKEHVPGLVGKIAGASAGALAGCTLVCDVGLGCGFLGIYHLGVGSCIKTHASELMVGARIAGASAGAIFGCLLVCDVGLGECTEDVLEIVMRARSHTLGPLHPSFNVTKIVQDGLRKVLPPDAHKCASGRLFVSLTRLSDGANVMISQFDSREDLIQALLCSAFIPFYSGLIPPSYKGVRYIDGGVSDNVPSFGDAENTITVSPFAGESDICPPSDDTSNYLHMKLSGTSIQLTPSNLYRLSRALFPPEPEIMTKMCRQGFEDALTFLKQRGLVSCTRHLSLRSISEVNMSSMMLCEDGTDSVILEDDEEDYLIEEMEHCSDCNDKKQEFALIDNLPQPVLAALHHASESVNSSYIKSLVSIATLPCLLPIQSAYSIVTRFIDWIPHLPTDLQAFLYFMWQIAKYVVQHIEDGRHSYSARFSCQLAITESQRNLNNNSDSQSDMKNVNFQIEVGLKKTHRVKWQIGDEEIHLPLDTDDGIGSGGESCEESFDDLPPLLDETDIVLLDKYDSVAQGQKISKEIDLETEFFYLNQIKDDEIT